MSDQSEAFAEGIDFAVVAYREEGVWQVEQIVVEKIEGIDSFAGELRRWPGDGGSLGMISVDEDFFILVRVAGASTRVLLSDVTAATDWPIARSALQFLEIPLPDDEDDQEPAGDLGILATRIAAVGVASMGETGTIIYTGSGQAYWDQSLGQLAIINSGFDTKVEVIADQGVPSSTCRVSPSSRGACENTWA